MPSPRLICKSGYITDNSYFMNLLEYSGNKLASQQLVFRDGSTREVDVDKVIRLTAGELAEVAGVHLCFKDGGGRTIPYETYLAKTVERRQMIRYSDVATIQNDSQSFGESAGPHEMKDLDFFKYLDYIEGRKGVEKEEGHGLFGLTGNIPIGDARTMAEAHEKSRKWSHIISMDADDAKSTGFDRRAMWQHLIVSKAPEIAEAYHINLENLVINCAFHGNTDNPHIHLMFYSKDPTEGFISGGAKAMNKATEKLKSTLVNEIFKGESATLGKEKSAYRKALMVRLQKWTADVMAAPVDDSLLCKLEQLSVDLDGLAGKKVYELLPLAMKTQVDEILQTAIAATPELSAVYEEYCKVQGQFIGRYISSPERLQSKLYDFQERFVHPGKDDLKQQHNIIVTAALELVQQRTALLRTFEGEIVDSITPDFLLSTPDFPEKTNALRTSEEKNANDTMPPPALSRGNVITSANIQKDLKKSLREHLDFALTNTDLFSAVLLRRQLEKLRSTGDSQITGEIIRYLYQTSDAFRKETDRHLQCVEIKLKAAAEADKVKDYLIRYREKLFRGKCTPLSGSTSWYAKCLDENLYRILLHENKSLLQAYHSKIYKGLFAALEDENGLAQLRKLQTMLRDSPDSTQEISAMVKALMLRAYDKDDPAKAVSVLSEDAERMAEQFTPIFEKHMDANTALMLSERLLSDLWNGETPAAGFIIREFATNVEENILTGFLKKQLSSKVVKTYRHQLYNALQRVYNKNTSEATQLRLLSTRPMTRVQFDEALAILSTPQNDLLENRESLYQSLYKDYQATANPPLPYDAYQKVVERFFYGEDGDSFFFNESVVSAANGELPLMSPVFPWKGLVVGLMRSIARLSSSSYESNHKEAHSGFETKRQFKNAKFHQECFAEP